MKKYYLFGLIIMFLAFACNQPATNDMHVLNKRSPEFFISKVSEHIKLTEEQKKAFINATVGIDFESDSAEKKVSENRQKMKNALINILTPEQQQILNKIAIEKKEKE